MKIEKYIARLLRDFDCIIIPGLGGFVANYSPAQYSLAKGLLTPPSKAVIFNRNLINNDGLLVNHFSVNEKISYNDAQSLLNLFVTDCKIQLASGKRIEFDELGVLYLDNENNLQFRPDYSANFLTDSFGLHPVVAKELVQAVSKIEKPVEVVETIKVISVPKEEKKEEVKSVTERILKPEYRGNESLQKEEKKIVPIRKRKIGRNLAIAAVVLPIIFYSVWIPLKTDVFNTGVIEVADLNPFRSPVPASIYTPEKINLSGITPAGMMPTLEESAIEEPIIESKINDDIDSTLVDNNIIIDENLASNNFHVIAGCFREDENAQNMVAYLQSKGYKAFVLDTVNGLKRVSAASFDNVGDALSALRDIRGNNVSEAWLLTGR